jgi:hypothetical protein
MIAHIKDGKVVNTYPEAKGRVTFANGDTVSPPDLGAYGDEQIVPVVLVTVDNSTGTRKRSSIVQTVEADRVLRTTTISNIPIEEIRAGMSCSKMQGVLTLGEANWSKVMAFYTTDATWVQKPVIDSAGQWQRVSENIQFIGYLIGFNDEQMDSLFTTAALVEA